MKTAYMTKRILAGTVVPAIIALAAAVSSCTRTEPEDGVEDSCDNCIAFYVKSLPTKAIIEDTETLNSLKPAIYVTEDLRGTEFNNTRVDYLDNGVWRSMVDWASGNVNYSFYAYTYSVGGGRIPERDSSTGTISNNGKMVTIIQPDYYVAADNVWTDFLMSYTVNASSSRPALVNLEFERVTTGVELYISASPAMENVRLTSVSFSGVIHSATFILSEPATSSDPAGSNGMKNAWRLSRDYTKVTEYEYAPEGGLQIKKFDPSGTTDGKFSYSPEYRVMYFLTVQQPTYEEAGSTPRTVQLHISYTTEENGTDVQYDVTFDLSGFSPATWTRGHKIRYYLSIDTSTELKGTIAKWEEVDFIESTLLPDDTEE